MKFETIRDSRNNTAQIRRDLQTTSEIILTADGRPFAVLTRVDPDTVEEEVAGTLGFMRAAAEVVSPRPLAVKLPDESDLPLLEVAAEGGAILVTGNPHHFPRHARAGVTVLSPREFLDLLARSV